MNEPDIIPVDCEIPSELLSMMQDYTISTYISTYNSLFYQATLEQTIRHALLYSDEVVAVNSEHSSDGTQALLDDLKSEYPDKIKLYTFKEDDSKKQQTVAEKKAFALRKCTMDYCILQDDDEMIHEKHAETIHRLPVVFPDAIAFRFNVIHFYRSYTRHQPARGDWYAKKIYMVKNLKEITHGRVNDDPDNHVINGAPLDWMPGQQVVDAPVTVFHYGWCRNDAVMLLKKYYQEMRWWGPEYWTSHEFPFKLDDPESLSEFTGTHPKYMIPIIESEMRRNTRYIKEFTMKKVYPGIDNITIETSTFCNARCLICPNGSTFRDSYLTPLDDFESNLRMFPDLKQVALCGMYEPLADNRLPQIFEIIKKVNPSMEITIFTNARLLNKWEDLILDNVASIIFSVHGFSIEVYNKVMRGLDRDDTYKNIINFCKKRKERGAAKPRTTVSFVRTALNIAELQDFGEFWKPYVDNVASYELMNWNGQVDISLRDKPKTTVRACPMYGGPLVIDAFGNVVRCCYNFRFSYGNVRKGGMDNWLAKVRASDTYPDPDCMQCDGWRFY